MERTCMLFYTTSHLFWGWGKGSFPGLVLPTIREVLCDHLFIIPSAISAVTLTVHFLSHCCFQ